LFIGNHDTVLDYFPKNPGACLMIVSKEEWQERADSTFIDNMNGATKEIIENYACTTSDAAPIDKGRLERSSFQLRRRMGPWMPMAGVNALDIGCGRGEMLYMLAQHGIKELAGVNLCGKELEIAEQYVDAELVCKDAIEYLEQTDRKFDLITAFNFLEHLDKNNLLRCLRGISRCLKNRGHLIAMIPNAVSPYGTLTRHWDFTHEWAFTPNNFRQLAVLAGMDPNLEVRECGPIPHGFVSGIRWLLWKIVVQCIRFRLMVEVGDDKGGVYTMDMLVRLRKQLQPEQNF